MAKKYGDKKWFNAKKKQSLKKSKTMGLL